MSDKKQGEVDFGKQVVMRLVGSTITAFGGSETGEVFLSIEKDGETGDFIIGKDEAGEIALFEVEE